MTQSLTEIQTAWRVSLQFAEPRLSDPPFGYTMNAFSDLVASVSQAMFVGWWFWDGDKPRLREVRGGSLTVGPFVRVPVPPADIFTEGGRVFGYVAPDPDDNYYVQSLIHGETRILHVSYQSPLIIELGTPEQVIASTGSALVAARGLLALLRTWRRIKREQARDEAEAILYGAIMQNFGPAYRTNEQSGPDRIPTGLEISQAIALVKQLQGVELEANGKIEATVTERE